MAGGQERTAYLHPGSDGGLRMCGVSAEEHIASCRRAGRGISAQVHAMYPKMRPRLHRHLPQVQQGYEEARGALLGGLGNGAGAGGLSLWRRGPSTGAASSSLGSMSAPAAAAVAVAVAVSSAAPGAKCLQHRLRMDTWIPLRRRREVLRWLLRCLLPLRHRRHLPLRHVVRQRLLWMGTPMVVQLLNASGDRAMWRGFELQFFNGQPYFYGDRQWWLARGPSPRTHPYNQATHWWEPYEP